MSKRALTTLSILTVLSIFPLGTLAAQAGPSQAAFARPQVAQLDTSGMDNDVDKVLDNSDVDRNLDNTDVDRQLDDTDVDRELDDTDVDRELDNTDVDDD
ncbi:MAG TPA: hypothetical protein VKN76_06045 [Kiloniellaceae bacterium]|nr:hypothetical protein [Kiloniellaceae bacterium]